MSTRLTQKVNLSTLINNPHENVGAQRRLHGVHPAALDRDDADVHVHFDAEVPQLDFDCGRLVAAQLLVVPQAAEVFDEDSLDVFCGYDGDFVGAGDVCAGEEVAGNLAQVEVLGSAGSGFAGRGLESCWGVDEGSGLE